MRGDTEMICSKTHFGIIAVGLAAMYSAYPPSLPG
jgi:hypothetical protein